MIDPTVRKDAVESNYVAGGRAVGMYVGFVRWRRNGYTGIETSLCEHGYRLYAQRGSTKRVRASLR